jgi:E3 ubiquitin-protein ligase MARCH6
MESPLPAMADLPSQFSDAPDLMNDPTTDGQEKSPEDPDTCRICRGEGSSDEPLFYPCKCSGSIKFVHQDCLMEWLSHSQKKYCELCKTPFRFTKLYSPLMPKKLPTSVFIRKAIFHLISHLLVWFRGLLVGGVWILCLPWSMRYAWRIIFWVADAGWARNSFNDELLLDIAKEASLTLDSSAVSTPAGSQTSSLIPSYLNIQSQTLNFTRGQPWLFKWTKNIAHGIAALFQQTGLLPAENYNATVDPLVLRMAKQEQSSILSDVVFLKTLTPWPKFNRTLMDVLEGQIITLSVVVAFILIFLIREWVVQQQPVVDMGAVDADNALAQAGGGAHNQAQADDGDAGEIRNVDFPGEGVQARRNNIVDPFEDLEDNRPNASFSAANLAGPGPSRETETNIEDLKQQVEYAEKIINSLPEDVQAALRQGSVQEAVAKLPPEDAARMEEEVKKWSRDGGFPGFSSGQIDGAESSDHESDSESHAHDSTVPSSARPSMPLRGRSFLAADIERDLEERSLEEKGDDIQADVDSDVVQDEQRSQDSAGSWQHVSQLQEPSKLRDTSAEPVLDHTTPPSWSFNRISTKGKERARTPSPQPANDEHLGVPSRTQPSPSVALDHGESVDDGDRDDASWMSTVDSTESYTKDDLGMGDNPFALEDNQDFGLETPLGVGGTDSVSSQREASLATGQQPGPQPTLVDNICNWFWGDIPRAPVPVAADGELVVDEDDEHIVEDIEDEAPFVPFAQALPRPAVNQPAANGALNPEMAGAAAQAGFDLNDPDAIEDAEDLEGILELIGMQGPIIGLFQNALFSAVLIFISVLAAVWVPYVYGKLVLLTTAMPELIYKVPLRMVILIADLAIDLFLILVGYTAYLIGQLYRICLSAFYVDVTERYGYKSVILPALNLAQGAVQRLLGGASSTADLESKDFLYLSMGCHAALDAMRETITASTSAVFNGVAIIVHAVSSITPKTLPGLLYSQLPHAIWACAVYAYDDIMSTIRSLWTLGTVSIPLGTAILLPDNPMLAYWTATDRAYAVIAGYAAVALAGALYLKVAPITTSTKSTRIESQIIELFQQAGGVLKVILIISIEMIAFPLFCGFLLDFALMPLFESATFSSRFTFTIMSPWTSGFVHWFVGTCYMFHFALFVSMCRRIMRGGVLYFIRDPDDPTFHPVRDVLERSVITQLRKIAFSAIVYGALIVVCLGGVVWSLWAVSDSVLPIHWTSSESSFEFPLDILFYNFLTPVIVRFARPSDGLHAMYTWWFRRCARALRLSDFLFRESYPDEEGHQVHRTWKAWFTRKKGEVENDFDGEDHEVDDDKDEVDDVEIDDGEVDDGEDHQVDDGEDHEVEDEKDEERKNTKKVEETEVYFQKDGRHVRAPASDQVRIPKGSPVFVEVDEENNRIDGKPDDEGIHSRTSDMITIVYIPPWFRVRIGLFVVAVWLFAAATGISVTIVPLLFGRKLLSTAIPNADNVNDIYAFSLGIYILGGLLYTTLHYRAILTFLHSTFWPSSASRTQAFATFASYTKRTFSVVYVYSSLAVALPLVFAILLELYVLMPIHVTFGPEESHVIHLIQDWTLGILYVRIGTRILMWDRESRASRTVRAVVADGYLNPNARLVTRAFILPTLLAFVLLLGAPFAGALVANATYFRASTAQEKVKIMRLAYPVALGVATSLWSVLIVGKATERWRLRIRDEVYLIGERLHNFGEKRPGSAAGKAAGKGKARAEA